MTYSDLVNLFDHVAERIGTENGPEHARIGVMIENRARASAANMAVLDCAVVCPVPPGLDATSLEVLSRTCRLDALIADPSNAVARTVAERVGISLFAASAFVGAPAGGFRLEEVVSGETRRQPDASGAPPPGAILLTSGTTSQPKPALVDHDALIARGLVQAESFELGPNDVALPLSPPHVSASLNRMTSTFYSGGSLFYPEKLDADLLLSAIGDGLATWFAASPTFLKAMVDRVLQSPDLIAGQRLRVIRATSMGLSPELQSEVEAVFGVPCLSAYASTETGEITTNLARPGHMRPGTVGKPTGNTIEIRDDSGRPLPPGAEGEIVVSGPSLARGYLGRPEETAEAFENGWYRTGDIGTIDDDGFLRVIGRRSQVINRGGLKISPEEIEAVAVLRDDIAEAVCFGAPHPTLGEVPWLAVRPDPDSEFDQTRAERHLRERLEPHKRPVRIVVTDRIERTSTGKPRRDLVADRLGRATEAAEPAKGSNYEDPLVACLALLWADTIGTDGVAPTDNFFDAGGDSLMAMRLVTLVGEVTGVELPFETIYENGATPEGMAGEIRALRAVPAAPVPLPEPVNQSNGRKRPLAKRLRKLYRRFWLRRQPKLGRKNSRPQLPTTPVLTTEDAIKRLWLITTRWAGRQQGQTLPMFVQSESGAGPILFWCATGGGGTHHMSKLWGDRRSLVAFRSLNLVVENRSQHKELVEDIGRLYADEVLRMAGDRLFFLGGNCGGGEIAEAIARSIHSRTGRLPPLFLLEAEPSEPYDAPVSMFFGAESRRFNPFYSRKDPHLDWDRMHADVTWDVIPGNHGQFWAPPYIDVFAERLGKRLDALTAAEKSGLVPA